MSTFIFVFPFCIQSLLSCLYQQAVCVLDEAWSEKRCVHMKAMSEEESDVSMELISISDMEIGHRQ